jgi:cyclic beta-1,2-glucan synthetase
VDLLLQERIPQNAPVEETYAEDGQAAQAAREKVVTEPWRVRVNTPYPHAHILSNGRYGLLITNSGAGFSTWQEIDLTRWQADTTLNNRGTWIYIRDKESGALWSTSYQPLAVPAERQDVYFSPHMAEFRRRDQKISSVMDITVAPEEDVEIRRVTLTNNDERHRRLSLTSYGEVILAPHATDLHHPAFNKLFIESEYLSPINALLYHRRPRSEVEKPVYLLHSLFVEADQPATGLYEGDRARFLGRGMTTRSPAALTSDRQSSGTVGATLDPILSLSQVIDLEPHETCQVTFLTIVASSRTQALALAAHYREWRVIERTFDLARSRAEVELRQLGISSPDLERTDRLLSLLLYPHAVLRSPPAILNANQKGQPGLWGYSISGDYPILLVRVESEDELQLIQ